MTTTAITSHFNNNNKFKSFLDASSHLFNRLCRSIGWSVGRLEEKGEKKKKRKRKKEMKNQKPQSIKWSADSIFTYTVNSHSNRFQGTNLFYMLQADFHYYIYKKFSRDSKKTSAIGGFLLLAGLLQQDSTVVF